MERRIKVKIKARPDFYQIFVYCKGRIFAHADFRTRKHAQWIVFKKDESDGKWYATYGDDFVNRGYRRILSIKQ